MVIIHGLRSCQWFNKKVACGGCWVSASLHSKIDTMACTRPGHMAMVKDEIDAFLRDCGSIPTHSHSYQARRRPPHQ